MLFFSFVFSGETHQKLKSPTSTDVQARPDWDQLLFKRVNETRSRGRTPGTDAVPHLSDSFTDDSKTPQNRSVACRVKPKVFVTLPNDLATPPGWTLPRLATARASCLRRKRLLRPRFLSARQTKRFPHKASVPQPATRGQNARYAASPGASIFVYSQ